MPNISIWILNSTSYKKEMDAYLWNLIFFKNKLIIHYDTKAEILLMIYKIMTAETAGMWCKKILL